MKTVHEFPSLTDTSAENLKNLSAHYQRELETLHANFKKIDKSFSEYKRVCRITHGLLIIVVMITYLWL